METSMRGLKKTPGLNQKGGVSGHNPMIEHGDQAQSATSVGIRFPITVEVPSGRSAHLVTNDPKLNTPMGSSLARRK